MLERMKEITPNPKPPSAYRALEFLQEHGFIHRIESLNAYVKCNVNHLHHGSQFMVCDSCGRVTEIHLCSLPDSLKAKVDSEQFHFNHWKLEIHGLCQSCHA